MNPAAAECAHTAHTAHTGDHSAHTGDDGQAEEAEEAEAAGGCRVCEGSCRAAWLCLLLHGLSSAEYEACVAAAHEHGAPTRLASAGGSNMARGPLPSPLWGAVLVLVLGLAAVAARHVSRRASPQARRQAEWLAASSCTEHTRYTAMPSPPS